MAPSVTIVAAGVAQPDNLVLEKLAGKDAATMSVLVAVESKMHCVTRYPSSSQHWWFNSGEPNWDDGYGSCDAVMMQVDRPIRLAGLGLYTDGEGSTYNVMIIIATGQLEHSWRPDDASIISKTITTFSGSDDSHVQVMLDSPVRLEACEEYTVLAAVWGNRGYYGQSGVPEITHDESGVSFTFTPSNASSNGTSPESGGLPAVYFFA